MTGQEQLMHALRNLQPCPVCGERVVSPSGGWNLYHACDAAAYAPAVAAQHAAALALTESCAAASPQTDKS